jgi:hypothetical protein
VSEKMKIEDLLWADIVNGKFEYFPRTDGGNADVPMGITNVPARMPQEEVMFVGKTEFERQWQEAIKNRLDLEGIYLHLDEGPIPITDPSIPWHEMGDVDIDEQGLRPGQVEATRAYIDCMCSKSMSELEKNRRTIDALAEQLGVPVRIFKGQEQHYIDEAKYKLHPTDEVDEPVIVKTEVTGG